MVMERYRILGIPFDDVGIDEAIIKVEQFLRDGKSHIITYLSLPTLMMARRNKFLRIFLQEADIIIPCGKHILWAVKVLKRPLHEAVDPSLFTKMLMNQSVELGKTVYLFGGKDVTIDRASTNLKREIPRLFLIGKYRGNYPKRMHEDIVQAIGKASPDYFFIGLGSPSEELWVERNKEKIHAKITVLVGGLFDLFAGNIRKSGSYRTMADSGKGAVREVPQPRAIRKLWWVPLFVIFVWIEKLFWKH